jgi:uncharacterized protein with von Willebrand factor type A (vWA) domain
MNEAAPVNKTDVPTDAAAQFLLRLQLLVARARARGVAVSTDQVALLVHATSLIDVTERAALKRVAGITLAGDIDDLATLDTIVDEVFPRAAIDDSPSAPPGAQDIRERLLDAVTRADSLQAELLGQLSADLLGAADEAGTISARRGSQRVLRALDLSELMRRAIASHDLGEDVERAASQRDTLASFERSLLAELRRRASAATHDDSGQIGPPSEEVLDADLLHLSEAELAQLRELVRPLARRLAARARRRRETSRRGRLDVPRTQRRALGTGGVPLQPVLRRRRRQRPEVVVLCDVSGSMADYARFTLTLLQALVDELPRLRAFVFVDGVGDVTALLRTAHDLWDTRALLLHPGVVVGDGHSDYGQVLTTFVAQPDSVLSTRTTLVVIGDARARGGDPRTDVLAALKSRVAAVHWLNPEPRALWGDGDSEIAAYLPNCNGIHEIRTLRQLAHWVEQLVI